MNELGYLSPRTILHHLMTYLLLPPCKNKWGFIKIYISGIYVLVKEFFRAQFSSIIEAPIIEGHEVFEKNPGGKKFKHKIRLNKNDFNINFYLDKKFKKRFKSSIEFIFDGTILRPFLSRISNRNCVNE